MAAPADLTPAEFPPAVLARVRAAFPALATPWALFDNAGGSVPLGEVADRVHDHMRRLGVQLGASYALSVEATERVALGHRAAERLVNAEPGEVVLGSSTTSNLRLLAHALTPGFAPGDEVVVTDLDHEANIGPWRGLEARGVVVREWRFRPETQRLELADLEPLLGPRTRLVCFTHCSNVVGTLHDARAVIARVRAAGALSCVDGVAFAPHRRVDVKALGADFYALSLYKVFGPHLGLLYGRRELLERVASQNHFFLPASETAYRLEPGGVPHELASSLPAVPEHLAGLAAAFPDGAGAGPDALAPAFAAIARHEAALAGPLLAFLRERRGVRLLGEPSADASRRVPTIAFTVDGRRASEIPAALDRAQVAIRWGHFYAWRAIAALGLHEHDGIVRVSMAHYNTPAEVARLIAALDAAL